MTTNQTITGGVTEHQRSVAAFIAAAVAVPDEAWERPLAEGKWTPAQVAEHLRLTYEVLGRQIAGGPGVRIRTAWWIRPVLRLRFLSPILRAGEIPRNARAPSELRPGAGPFPRGEVLRRLEEGAVCAETALTGGGTKGLVHHVFGRLGAGPSLRFLSVHNLHHARQLERPGAPRR